MSLNTDDGGEYHKHGSLKEDYELEYDSNEEAVYFILDGERCNDFFGFEDINDDGKDYWLVNMFSPVSRIGLGRAALECFIDHTQSKIHVRDRWMTDSSDGSHVLPEAWPFVQQMMKEGLIVPHDELSDDHWDTDHAYIEE